MSALLPDIDPDGMLEFSVVFTDRSLNHMSKAFQGVMTDISATLKEVYNADAVALVPGGGTYAMEAVARQFATGKRVMVIRNGFFSFRWSQIFEMGSIPSAETVMKARRVGNAPDAPFAPAPIDEVVARIRDEKPDVVFAPHVETASGMILPDDYISAVADAVHAVGGIFVLDCIASGCAWVDMKATGVDVLISAPQKGWSAQPSAGIVMMNDTARDMAKAATSTSFAVDLGKWLSIMEAYEGGGHAYHATMPTDALRAFRDTMLETKEYGFEKLRDAQWEQGRRVRALLADNGIKSVAAEGFEAPGVVVSYTADPDIKAGKAFAAEGVQIAAGVPLMVDEGDDYSSFRLGLFGLDKLYDVDASVARLKDVLTKVL
ncbi:aspartate aminotransferase [Aliiroseovarius halocynthiae]|uniref:Alanine--glyoxylate aminotransferase family protein n=1 Tax=Aliiroseovarius halocynthiae TaxID=985055 RepID=A0A545SRA8_9RHOB|nr:aminotransferase class V-fold PLP-dependent enzyme [Aliiroseovarius halocynthiae]TQV67504.1 alanine--glyoxylate aminotransferase family protein [Aliiroseovarius halocynthiae]SMR81514.1 aspartate aminotransferase [Aliiroseovarius halocynthiae]